MSGAIFWGSILLLIGLTMIVNVIFKVDLPVARIVLAVVLIFIAVKLLFGRHIRVFNHESKQCNEYYYTGDNKKHQEYNAVFSKGHVDLRTVQLESNEPTHVLIHNVFGSTDVLMSKDVPFRITSNTAFASVNIPNGNEVVVGTANYQSDSLDTSKPYLDVKMDVVFGNVKVMFY